MTKHLSVPRIDITALARAGAAALVAILTLDTLARSTVSALVPLIARSNSMLGREITLAA